MIIREQFSAYDGDLHPECDNRDYLDYEKVDSGLSEGIIKYGYKQLGPGTRYRWVKKSDVNVCTLCDFTPPSCPASEKAGDFFSYALSCKYFKPKLSIVKPLPSSQEERP